MTPIQPVTDRRRIHLRATQHVHGEPEAIFPLLCPVREFDWIPSWECQLVYTESGVAEEGCVFQTDMDGDPDTWVISRFEPRERISFIRVHPLRVIRYDIYLQPQGDGSTVLRWEQEITALDEDGDRHVGAQSQEEFAGLIAKVEQMLDHYLKTGEPMTMDYSGT